MKDEKALEKCYEGKLLGNNNECPLSLKTLTTIQLVIHHSFELM